MLTRSDENTLRGLFYVERNPHEQPIPEQPIPEQPIPEQPIPGRRIAHQADIPVRYLSKILNNLIRIGILESSRGRKGDFRLLRRPRDIQLHEVLGPYERFLGNGHSCPFGDHVCIGCIGNEFFLARESWNQLMKTYGEFLNLTSLYDVVVKKVSNPAHGGTKRS